MSGFLDRIGGMFSFKKKEAIEEVRQTEEQVDNAMHDLQGARERHRQAIEDLLTTLVTESLDGSRERR